MSTLPNIQIPRWLHITFMIVAPCLIAVTHLISSGSITADGTVTFVLLEVLSVMHSVDPQVPLSKNGSAAPPSPPAAAA